MIYTIPINRPHRQAIAEAKQATTNPLQAVTVTWDESAKAYHVAVIKPRFQIKRVQATPSDWEKLFDFLNRRVALAQMFK